MPDTMNAMEKLIDLKDEHLMDLSPDEFDFVMDRSEDLAGVNEILSDNDAMKENRLTKQQISMIHSIYEEVVT